jgi:outer membrane biosynthesis protein TonB
VVTNGVVEEPISSELVLVDQALGRRARAALPDPPWLVPALAELRERPREERVQAPVVERPARPPERRRRPSAGSVVLVVIGLAFAGVAALAFVPQSHGPSFAKAPVDQAAPAAPVRPPVVTRPKAAPKPKPKPKPRQPRQTAKPKKVRQAPATRTRAKRRESKPKPALAPKPRTLTRAQRVVTWRRYPAAVYYAVYLQRGTKTLFQTRTVRPDTLLPAGLALKPGTYHVVVRPAIPNDAGIILGPTLVRKTVKL